MTDGTDATGTPEPQQSGLFDTWLNLYFAPRQAFEAIVSRPRILVPLILVIAISLVFVAIWVSHVDAVEFLKTQMQDSGQWDKMSAQQREGALQFGPKFFKIQAWVMPPVVTLLWYVISTAYFLVACRFFYGASTKFKTLFSINVWAGLAISALATPLMLVTLFLKGDWNINPQEAFQANLAMFLDKSETARWLWSLAGSIDLFSLWLIVMLSIGLGVAMKKKATAAAWPVIIGWAVLVAIKVGWAAIMG
jgi:hypothetical protein